jgi:hypothetical protein
MVDHHGAGWAGQVGAKVNKVARRGGGGPGLGERETEQRLVAAAVATLLLRRASAVATLLLGWAPLLIATHHRWHAALLETSLELLRWAPIALRWALLELRRHSAVLRGWVALLRSVTIPAPTAAARVAGRTRAAAAAAACLDHRHRLHMPMDRLIGSLPEECCSRLMSVERTGVPAGAARL